MKTTYLSSEVLEEKNVLPTFGNIKKMSPDQAPRKRRLSLKDLPLELRKKEASKPLYLIRYE